MNIPNCIISAVVQKNKINKGLPQVFFSYFAYISVLESGFYKIRLGIKVFGYVCVVSIRTESDGHAHFKQLSQKLGILMFEFFGGIGRTEKTACAFNILAVFLEGSADINIHRVRNYRKIIVPQMLAVIPWMTKHCYTLITGKPHLLTIPLINDFIKNNRQCVCVGFVHTPMTCTDCIAHTESNKLFLGAGQSDRIESVGNGRLVSVSVAVFFDIVIKRLTDRGEFCAKNKVGMAFLKIGNLFHRVVQTGQKPFIIKIYMIGNDNLGTTVFFGSFSDLAERKSRVIGCIAVYVPVGMNYHSSTFCREIYCC